MKNIIQKTSIFILLFVSVVIDAQDSYLWKINSKNGIFTTYLFATIPLVRESYYKSHPNLDKALKASEKIYLPFELPEYEKRDKTDDLEKNLTSEELLLLKNTRRYFPVSIKRLYPDEIIQILEKDLELGRCNYFSLSDLYSLEGYVQKKAKEYEKSIEYLNKKDVIFDNSNKETPIDQKKGYDRLKALLAINYFHIIDQENCPKQIQEYFSFKIPYKLSKSCLGLTDSEASAVVEKNKKLVNILNEVIESENSFVVIDVKHFRYRCGLLAELTNLGYQLEPVPMK